MKKLKFYPPVNRMHFHYYGLEPEVYYASVAHDTGGDFGQDPEYYKELNRIQKALMTSSYMYGFSYETKGAMGEVLGHEAEELVSDTIYGMLDIGNYDMAKTLSYVYVEPFLEDYLNEHNLTADEMTDKELDDIAINLFPRFLNFTDEEWQKLTANKVTYTTYFMEAYDHEYTAKPIRDYVEQHVNEFCIDEQGRLFDSDITGKLTNVENPTDGIYYELEMLNGKAHGKFTFQDNSQPMDKRHLYSGEFEQGELKNYEVLYSQKDKIRYEFDMVNGKKIRIRTEYFENGNPKKQTRAYEEYSRKKIGEQKKWYESGKLEEIENYHEDGVYTSISYYESGKVWSKYLKHDNKTIKYEIWHENGERSFERYVDDKKQEHETRWHDDGSLHEVKIFDNDGNYIEHHSFHKDGSKQSEYWYVQYKDLKPKNCWDTDGNQLMKDGTGLFRQYNYGEFGYYLYSETEYQQGIRHGIYNRFRPNGNIWDKEMYEEGKQVSHTIYDEDGNEV